MKICVDETGVDEVGVDEMQVDLMGSIQSGTAPLCHGLKQVFSQRVRRT